ncbi:Ig-like domain-containing protein [Leifsonia sp. fls2-241-R2A-40a]|uniref:Ig-like domain-containing protein n=1 Tax=Leifsonia sp. fls2-241-R2A-40a TaxID=3040290 RepID=UPI00254B8660|nr:Ig-like domain-containing protein [Leifsonia sp. fls2-241-R2A-40a]
MIARFLTAALAGLILAGAAVGVSAGPAEAASPSSFDRMLGDLRPLETYARQYAAANPGETADELVLVYLRTANPHYDDSTWATVGGERDPDFEAYVESQDARNGTSAAGLKQLRDVTLPNGEVTDAVHMFATMNLSRTPNSAAADLGGFAGDITDLMSDIDSVTGGPAAVQAAAAADFRSPAGGFSDEDLRADLDAVNLTALRAAAPQTPYADLLTGYFANLTERKRVDAFLTNRFPATPRTPADLREAVESAYTSNAYISLLEYRRGLSSLTDQRTAAITMFSAYLAEVAHVVPVTLTSPAGSASVSTATPAVSGTGEPGATVTLADVSGRVVGTTAVDAGGVWSVITAALPAGRAGLTATQTAGGGVPTTATVVFQVVMPRAVPAAEPWIGGVAVSAAALIVLAGLVFAGVVRRRRLRPSV